jgi:hypothetical protein
MDITDSIPMEEIVSVQVETEKTDKLDERTEFTESPLSIMFRKIGMSIGMSRNSSKVDTPMHGEEIMVEMAMIQKKVRASKTTSPQLSRFCDNIMRIETKPSGFNRGAPYYFLLRRGKYSAVKNSGDVESRSLESVQDISEVANQLCRIAAKRRMDYERETRFHRFQQSLLRVWNSMPFNLLVLGLIVSNFIFTVQQLENSDSGRQRFFETVDLAYTIIFSIGARPPLPA